MNEDEIQEYEEKMQKKIQEVWASMDQKTEILQKEYQDQLETIIEEVAQQKFERIAEVKVMYKGRTDEESKTAMDEELAEIRLQTDQLKEAKIREAKDQLEKKKQELKQEKMQFMNSIKGSIRDQVQQQEYVTSPASPRSKEFKTPYTMEKQPIGDHLVDSDGRVFP